MHKCFAIKCFAIKSFPIRSTKIVSKPITGFGVGPLLLASILSPLLILGASAGFSAGMDSLSKPAVPEKSAPTLTTPDAMAAPVSPVPVVSPVPAQPVVAVPPLEKVETDPPVGQKDEAENAEPVVKSDSSLFLEKRFSLGTSVGWAVVKPSKGTWVGLGASEVSFQWRLSSDDSSPLSVTGRYAPFAGVWTVNKRDYDVAVHGIYGGAEYRIPAGTATLRAAAELGYMLIYARAQDKTKLTSDVMGGKANISLGGGADWKFASDKILVGPFARFHVGGFSIFNVGASARFVF